MAIKPTSFKIPSSTSLSTDEEQSFLVTSYSCKWNVPKSRKDSTIPMSEAVFEKHEYSKQRKRKIKLVEDYMIRGHHNFKELHQIDCQHYWMKLEVNSCVCHYSLMIGFDTGMKLMSKIMY